MTSLIITSWVVFAASLIVTTQNLIYLRKGGKRRPNLHFAIGLMGVYFSGLYFLAAVDPTIYLVRTGIATKVGIVLMLYLLYKVTKSDEEDYRLEDRIGRH